MKINYNKILNQNMINVFKDVLRYIKKNGLQDGHHLYITFNINDKEVNIPKWLKDKHKNEMTIVLQYEYWNLIIKDKFFNIGLSFDDIKTDLEISFNSIISFADPFANFGLRLNRDNINNENNIESKTTKVDIKKNNVIDFKKYKKI